MIQVTMRLNGTKEKELALEQYGAGVRILSDQFAWLTLKEGKDELEVYPPAPSRTRSFLSGQTGARGKRYVSTRAGPKRSDQRTGLLGSSWKLVEAGKGGWRLSNDARRRGIGYAGYVHGNSQGAGQAWMHVGRWKLMRPVVDASQRRNVPKLKIALVNLAREKGLAH